MKSEWISGLVTVGFVAWFIATTYWAFSKKNKEKFEFAARLPLEDDMAPRAAVAHKEGAP